MSSRTSGGTEATNKVPERVIDALIPDDLKADYKHVLEVVAEGNSSVMIANVLLLRTLIERIALLEAENRAEGRQG